MPIIAATFRVSCIGSDHYHDYYYYYYYYYYYLRLQLGQKERATSPFPSFCRQISGG